MSFNSVLEADAIPIIKNNNLMSEKIGSDNAIKQKEIVSEKDLFMPGDIFPSIGNEE